MLLILILFYAALCVTDVLTTFEILKRGGYERNPVLNKLGVWLGSLKKAIVAMKALTVVAAPAGLWTLSHYGESETALILGMAISVLVGAVIVNNVIVLWRLGKR